MSIAFNTALTALRAFEIKMDVNANNIANVETDGFKKSRVNMKENAQGGVQATTEQINLPGISLGTNEKTGAERESSNVNGAEEFVDQMVTQYGYEANVLTVRTAHSMEQSLLDIFS